MSWRHSIGERLIYGVLGRDEIFPTRDQTPICLDDNGKAQRRSSSLALGDKTGERSSPLFMIVWYYHTHLAYVAYVDSGSIIAKVESPVLGLAYGLGRTHLGSLGPFASWIGSLNTSD